MNLTPIQRGKLLAIRAVLDDLQTGQYATCDAPCNCDAVIGPGCKECILYRAVYNLGVSVHKILED